MVRLRRASFALFGIFVMMFSIAQPASATALYSAAWYYGPILGITYYNQSIVSDNTVMTSGYSIWSSNGQTIPGGWSGGQGFLYMNGALCANSSMYYNPQNSSGWSGAGGINYCGYGNYNARGITAAYNGNGYNNYYTAYSPMYTH